MLSYKQSLRYRRMVGGAFKAPLTESCRVEIAPLLVQPNKDGKNSLEWIENSLFLKWIPPNPQSGGPCGIMPGR